MLNKDIVNNCTVIYNQKLSWSDSVKLFDINNDHIKKIYIRYLVLLYDYNTTLEIISR
nr:YPK11 [Saccharomycopsis selenospora]